MLLSSLGASLCLDKILTVSIILKILKRLWILTLQKPCFDMLRKSWRVSKVGLDRLRNLNHDLHCSRPLGLTPILLKYIFIKSNLGQVRLGQVRLGQVRLGQVRLGQVRLGQVRLGQVRLGQVRLGQVRLGQVRLGQVRIGQVRLGQVRLGKVIKISSSPIHFSFHNNLSLTFFLRRSQRELQLFSEKMNFKKVFQKIF